MEQYISKSAILAKIKKLMDDTNTEADIASTGECFNEDIANTKYQLCKYILDFIETLTVKEVDLHKEIKDYFDNQPTVTRHGGIYYQFIPSVETVAKHFFELGVSINNPITAADRGTAEEIIINLKRIENDYLIDLTKEMEWVRNKVKKGE